jgi:hypothetical protein
MTLPPLALVLDALPGPVPQALARAAGLGYGLLELPGVAERPAADLDALADSGLLVAGVELTVPDAGTPPPLRNLLAALRLQIADAGRLGAGYVLFDPTPMAGQEPALRAEFCSLLADAAAERKMPLCVASPPGQPLPAAHPNLYRWWRLTTPAELSNLPLPADVGAVRVNSARQSDSADLQALRQSLADCGYTRPLAVRPEPMAAAYERL